MEAKTNLKENAAAVVAASGGSTNAALHLPAIAHECGIAFDLFDVAEVFKRTPYIADLKPAGRFVAKDLFEAGGVPLLMKTLLDNGFMHGDCMTVIGYGMAENLKRVAWNSDQEVVRPADRPLTATGGEVGLRGNLAPEGAIVKVAGMDNLQLRNAGRRGNRGDRRLSRGIFGNMPSRSDRRATAPSPTRAGRPRRRAMRISEHILSVALFGFGLGLTTAYAFDGTKSPANIAPPVVGGVAVAPEGAGPSLGVGVGAVRPDAFQAFQTGAQALRAGDTKAALDALDYAARNGEVAALWKLGRMYADGDGVKQSDLRAFDYFRTLADSHADEMPGTRPAVFVAKAFVAIGGYYLAGIPNSDVKPDAVHAREMFWYAASYFGDSDAQYRLGRLYLDGQGTAKDPKQARRWLFTAAGKGQYEAQAVLGAMLFRGQSVPRDAARGLMWLILARDAATPKETWITDLYNAAVKQASEVERNVALVHVEQWIEQSRSGQRTP